MLWIDECIIPDIPPLCRSGKATGKARLVLSCPKSHLLEDNRSGNVNTDLEYVSFQISKDTKGHWWETESGPACNI